MAHPSTFSIVAYDPADQAWGIAVASKFPAVGAVVPWAKALTGAVATQAHANTTYGPRGLELLGNGVSAEQTLQELIAKDPEREKRQVGIVDVFGNSATFTGKECMDWAGGIAGPGFATQGNILAGEKVIRAVAERFQAQTGDLADRLYQALLAGDRAGGDRRGRQSAALLVVKPDGGYSGFNDRWIDYRVDDDPDPVLRLGSLLEMHRLYFGKSDPADELVLQGEPLAKLQYLLVRLGYYSGPTHGQYDPATRSAMEAFIGNENFEDRFRPESGRIDRPVYDFIIQRFGAA